MTYRMDEADNFSYLQISPNIQTKSFQKTTPFYPEFKKTCSLTRVFLHSPQLLMQSFLRGGDFHAQKKNS